MLKHYDDDDDDDDEDDGEYDEYCITVIYALWI